MLTVEAGSQQVRRARFAGNWVAGADGMSRSQRRRLMAVLRMAHRVLGINRRHLGLGSLGAGRAIGSPRGALLAGAALAAMGSLATSAQAQTVDCSAAPYDDYATTASCMGWQATATGEGATALGSGAVANASEAVAIGFNSQASGVASVAFGHDTRAIGASVVVIGHGAGVGSTTASSSSLAIGVAAGSFVSGAQNSAVGGGIPNVMRGAGSRVSGARNVAMGTGDGAFNLGDGFQAAAGSLVSGNDNVAIGTNAGIGVAANATTSIGFNARATATNAVAVGSSAQATGLNSLAMLPNAVANGSASIVIGGNSTALAAATNAVVIGASSEATASQGVAVGPNTHALGANATAVGAASRATQAGAAAFGLGANAGGARSVAVGAGSAAAGASAIALGDGAQATGVNSISIGTGNVVSGANSAAIGDPTTITGSGSYSLGNNNTINANNAFVVGSGVTVPTGMDGAVVLGNASTVSAAVPTASTSIAGTAYNFAGGAPVAGDVVSVGSATAPRQIQNVAAGRISGTSTDAINGSQLFATNQAVSTLGAGWTVSAEGANATNVGATSTTGNSIDFSNTDGNITVGKSAASNNVSFELADNITVDSVTAGGTVINTTGLTIAGGPSMTTVGINAGNMVIANVAAGVNPTDAVNVSQLTSATSGVTTAGMNFTGNDSSAGAVHRDLGQALAIQGAATTAGSYSGGNIRTVTDPATGAINIQLADAPTFGTVTVNEGGSGRITGVTAGVAGTDAVNVSQLQAVSSTANMGWNIQANGDVASNVAPGGTVQFVDGQNIEITRSGSDVTVATSADLVADSVTLAGGQVFNGAGLNMAGTTITNLADGQVSATSSEAVNGSQLFATNQQVTQNTTNITNLDNRVTTVEGAITNINTGAGIKYFHANSALADSQALGMDSVAIGPNAIANNAGDVALGNGSATAAVVGTASATIAGTTYNFAGASPTSTVSVGNLFVKRTITNVAAGRVSATSTDAINGSQLFATNQAIESVNSRVTASATHYYSVNSGRLAVGNYNNDGATGDRSLAAGMWASSSGSQSTAIGTGATANDAGSVALGSNSVTAAVVATPSTVINGTNYAFAGTAPTSTVSIGAVGAERTITNVAAGRVSATSTDAINGSQLFATNQTVSTLGAGWTVTAEGANGTNVGAASTTGNSIDFNNSDGNIVVAKSTTSNNVAFELADNITVDSVTAGGTVLNTTGLTIAGGPSMTTAGINAGNMVITNLADGEVSASSSEAVNGSQLFATNQRIDQTATNITNLDNRVTTVEGNLTNFGDTITNIAGDTSSTYTDANGDGIRYARTNETGLAQTDAFAQGVGSTALGYQAQAGAGNAVALGRGAQATVDGSLALGAGSVADRALAPATGSIPAATGFVPYNTSDQVLLGSVSVGGVGAYRQITNVADGTQAQDAVTLRQLAGALSSFVVTPIQYFHSNSAAADSLAIGQESVAIGPRTVVNGNNGIGMGNGAIVQATAPGGTAIGQNAQVAQADAIALGTNSQANGIQSVAMGAGANATHSGSVALGAGATTSVGSETGYTGYGLTALQNSAGEVSVGSAGAERKLTNVAAGSAATDAVNVSQLQAVDGRVTNIDNRVTNVEGSLTNLDSRVTTVENNVTNLGDSVANSFGGNSTYNSATGTVTTQLNVGGNTYNNVNEALQAVNQTAGAGWNIQANGGPSTNIGSNGTLNVTAGSNTVVTLNGNQLQVGVADNPTFAGMVTANGGLTVGGNTTVSMGGNVVQNVAAGAVNVSSTDAVNGSQLHQVQQVASNSVQYDSGGNSVTFNPGGGAVALHNVAAGVAPNDAVNVQQLNDGLDSAVGRANAYTDSKLAGITTDIRDLQRDSNAGIAGALAAAGLPQAFEPGRGMVAFGAGTFQGQSAFAVGLSRVMDDGRTVVKAGATYDTRKRAGANVGVGFQF